MRFLGFGRGFGRFNETRMYGRGRGLAEEAEHELELAHRNNPEFGNASTQGRADLILLVFTLGWILGPIRELWAVPHFGRIAALLVEAVSMLIAMVVSSRWLMRRFNVPQTLGSTIPMGLVACAVLTPAEIAGVVWVRGLFPPGISCELRDRSRRHFTGHVPAVCRDAVSRHAISMWARRSDHSSGIPALCRPTK